MTHLIEARLLDKTLQIEVWDSANDETKYDGIKRWVIQKIDESGIGEIDTINSELHLEFALMFDYKAKESDVCHFCRCYAFNRWLSRLYKDGYLKRSRRSFGDHGWPGDGFPNWWYSYGVNPYYDKQRKAQQNDTD